jgi:hypothetical protein
MWMRGTETDALSTTASRTLKQMQTLVQAWKQLWKWLTLTGTRNEGAARGGVYRRQNTPYEGRHRQMPPVGRSKTPDSLLSSAMEIDLA